MPAQTLVGNGSGLRQFVGLASRGRPSAFKRQYGSRGASAEYARTSLKYRGAAKAQEFYTAALSEGNLSPRPSAGGESGADRKVTEVRPKEKRQESSKKSTEDVAALRDGLVLDGLFSLNSPFVHDRRLSCQLALRFSKAGPGLCVSPPPPASPLWWSLTVQGSREELLFSTTWGKSLSRLQPLH